MVYNAGRTIEYIFLKRFFFILKIYDLLLKKKVGSVVISIFISIILLFLVKLFDCAFGVLKTICIYKDKYFLGAICASLGVVCFIYTAKQSGDFVYLTVFVATFLGNYLPPVLLNYLAKDKLFVYEVISNDINSGKKFADKMRTFDLEVNTSICFNNSLKKVVACRVYSKSKDHSKLIEKTIPSSFSYSVIKSI